MNQASITTMIACRDHGKYLQEAIDSIMNQTFKPTQFIIINDGSTDNTEHVIRRNVVKNKRIQAVKHQASLGNILSYNNGIYLATEPFFHLMAADDIMADKYFYEEAAMVLLTDHTVALCSIGLQWMDEEGRMLPNQALAPVGGRVGPVECLALMKEHGNFINGGGTLIRTGEQKNHLYDKAYPYTADMKNWIEVFKNGGSAYFFQRPGYLYRRHQASMSSTMSEAKEERNKLNHLLHEAINV